MKTKLHFIPTQFFQRNAEKRKVLPSPSHGVWVVMLNSSPLSQAVPASADQQLFPYFNSAEYNSLIRCVIEYCAGRLLDKVNLALTLVSLTEETLPFKQSHRS